MFIKMALREHIEASTLLLNDSQLPYMKFDDFFFPQKYYLCLYDDDLTNGLECSLLKDKQKIGNRIAMKSAIVLAKL